MRFFSLPCKNYIAFVEAVENIPDSCFRLGFPWVMNVGVCGVHMPSKSSYFEGAFCHE
jgi:hypothetical protein